MKFLVARTVFSVAILLAPTQMVADPSPQFCGKLIQDSVANSTRMHELEDEILGLEQWISRKSGAGVLRFCTGLYNTATSVPATLLNWCTNWLDPTTESVPSVVIAAKKDKAEWDAAEAKLVRKSQHLEILATKQKRLGTTFDRECYDKPFCKNPAATRLRLCYRWAWEFIYAR